MLETLKTDLQTILPEGWLVEYDEGQTQNFKALNKKNNFTCYIEENRSGQYTTTGFGHTRVDRVSLYLYRSNDGKPLTAEQRELIRTEIETLAIKPILLHYGDAVSDVKYNIEPSHFNSLETGINLTLNIKTDICI